MALITLGETMARPPAGQESTNERSVQINLLPLRQQHAAITAASDNLTSLFAMSFEDASGRLVAARSALARLIAEHLKTENDELHLPLHERGLTSRIPSYADIAKQTRELRLNYSAHIGQWSSATIELDWFGYTHAASAVCADLKAMITREEQELFPAAEALLKTEP